MNSETVVPAHQTDYVLSVAALGNQNVPPGGIDAMAEALAELGQHLPTTITDIGCNTGYVSQWLHQRFPDAEVVGIDINEEMIASATAQYGEDGLRFMAVDASQMREHQAVSDLIISAGSSAFFPDARQVYAAVGRALDPVRGTFLDLVYQYDPATPLPLLQQEDALFGVGCQVKSPSWWLRQYEEGGLRLRSWRRTPRWSLPEQPGAEVYRRILAGRPEFKNVVKDLQVRRDFTSALTQWRHPARALLDTAAPSPHHVQTETAATPEALELSLALSAQLAQAFSRTELIAIEAMSPFARLDYFGLGATAPGGNAAVVLTCKRLLDLGADPLGATLDIGCASGLSTVLVARAFPNSIGIDIQHAQIQASRVLGEQYGSPARFEQADIATLDWPSASVATVVLFASLGYMPAPEAALAKIADIVQDGGLVAEFLFDYLGDDEVYQPLRDSVSGWIKPQRLSDQVRQFEAAGLHLVSAERQARGVQAVAEQLDVIRDSIVQREMLTNPHLSPHDEGRLRELITEVLVQPDLGADEPHVYLCIFERGSRA